jgi:hypothetical protein
MVGKTPRYSWNTAKVGVQHQPINQSIPSKTHFCQFFSFLNAYVKFRQVSVEHIFQDECVNEW